MFTLPKIFSSHALFQRDSELTLHGKSSPDSLLCLKLTKNGEVVDEKTADTSSDGSFSVSLHTPDDTANAYELKLECSGDVYTMSDVLFGELWFASGQSNMELTNIFMDDCDAFITSLAKKNIRCFAQEYGSEFPYEPDDSLGGKWITIDELADFRNVSAAATAFVGELYRYFCESGAAVPVGFLNISWGGTPIGAWISREAIDSDEKVGAYEKKTGRFPTKENWNTHGDVNYQQLSAMFNQKTYPAVGVKTRGVIWYQGENDSGAEHNARIYKHDLFLYHKEYSSLFAPDDGKPFPMINSLIYPFNYGGSGETNVGWLNQAFIDASDEQPDKFVFAPINDLPPVWGFFRRNHPIHPTNKYALGGRMAYLAEVNAYGKAGQKMPASLESFETDSESNRLLLNFKNVGSGLRLEGKRARCLYICGDDGKYLPADCEITAPSTLAVSHPFIAQPKHAAYSFTDCEPEANLFAGEYPIAPFSTNLDSYFRIEARPWLDLDRDTFWEDRTHGSLLDTFVHPIWKPCAESEVCRDTVFARDGVSLRICGDSDVFGAYVTSAPSNRLDLYNYKALRFDVFNCPDDGFRLELTIRRDTGSYTVSLPAKKLSDLTDGESHWKRFEIDLSSVSAETTSPDAVLRMTLRFDSKGSPWRFVNVGSPVLIP